MFLRTRHGGAVVSVLWLLEPVRVRVKSRLGLRLELGLGLEWCSPGAAVVNVRGDQSRFTPEWCFTWSADGVGNNCIDVKGAYPTYDQGWLPQVIRMY
eukprot:1374452-Amorphochlora_amoeboformis.AAC.1